MMLIYCFIIRICLSLVSHFVEIIRYAAANHSNKEGFPQKNYTMGSPAFTKGISMKQNDSRQKGEPHGSIRTMTVKLALF